MPDQPAAACTTLAPVLDGPPREVEAVVVTPAAAYFTTGDPDTPALCLATPAAVRVPCALIVPTLPPLTIGARAVVGAGRLRIAAWTARVARWWRPPRPRVRPDLGGFDIDSDVLTTKIGEGPGLTPYWDDVVCGGLVALYARRPDRVGVVAEAVARVVGRTTFVSAALLRHAGRGECVPELAAFVDGGSRDAVLRIGHSSGAGLVRGVEMVTG